MNVSLVYAALVLSESFTRISVFFNAPAAINFFLTLVKGLTVSMKLDRNHLNFPVSSNTIRADAFNNRCMPNSN